MVIFTDVQLRKLKKDVKRSKCAAYASGTQNNLKTQWKTFIAFCLHFNFDYLPASLETVSLYVQFLSRSFKSVQSIKNYVNGVKLLHLYAGLEFFHLNDFEFRLLMRGLTRLNPHIPRQVLPITPDILIALLSCVNFSNQFDVAIWNSFLVAFYLMARKSSLIPSSQQNFDSSKHLTRRDFVLTKKCLTVTIKFTKTMQFRDRVLIIPVLANPGNPLCPVSNFYRMVKLIPARANSPAFCFYSQGHLRSITHFTFTATLRKWLKVLGFDSSAYSGHSFRRGGATWAFKSEVPGELIQIVGDWASDAYKLYIDTSFETKLSVSKKMLEHINHHI